MKTFWTQLRVTLSCRIPRQWQRIPWNTPSDVSLKQFNGIFDNLMKLATRLKYVGSLGFSSSLPDRLPFCMTMIFFLYSMHFREQFMMFYHQSLVIQITLLTRNTFKQQLVQLMITRPMEGHSVTRNSKRSQDHGKFTMWRTTLQRWNSVIVVWNIKFDN